MRTSPTTVGMSLRSAVLPVPCRFVICRDSSNERPWESVREGPLYGERPKDAESNTTSHQGADGITSKDR
jgi:hypothetical protein